MKNNIGHNNPPKEIRLTDGEIIILDKQGRINLKNSIIKKLPRSVNEKGDYIEKDYNDSERVGLKVRVNRGGSKTIWFRWYNKNIKNSDGSFGNFDKIVLGQFPETKIEAARSLVDRIKHGIKTGTDARSTIEANKAIPTFEEVVALWKKDVMQVSNAFRDSTKNDFEYRMRAWFYLEPRDKKLASYILANRAALNIKSKQVHEITHDDMVKYHRVITNKPSPYQANRIMDDLKLIVKWAMNKKQWKIQENFALLSHTNERNVELSRIETNDPYEVSELKKIRKQIVRQMYIVKTKKGKSTKRFARNFPALMGILAAMFVGRRYRNEILGVPWKMVDDDKIILPKTKNSKKPTTYTINRYLKWILKQCKAYSKYKFAETNSIRYHHKSGFVFPAPRKAKQQHIYDIDKTWKSVLAAAGVRKLPIYMLRHAWATNGLRATGNNIKDIKDAGGWKTFRMVERYAQQDENRNKQTSERVANFIATGH